MNVKPGKLEDFKRLAGSEDMSGIAGLVNTIVYQLDKDPNALMMAAVYLTAFFTGVGSGWLARFYETMPGWQFWGMHAAFCFVGALLLAVLGPILRRRMDRLEAEAFPVAATVSITRPA